MDIFKLKDLSEDERLTVLLGEAITTEEQVYMKPLSPDELSIKKDELTNAAILKAVIEDELAEIKSQYKDNIVDPLGNVLSSRRMLPEERQFRISSLNKAV